VQILGFLVGLTLLAGCAYLAFSKPAYREQMARLAQAPPWQLAAMLALSAGTIAISGLVFRAVLRPVRRLGAIDCVAVNGVCSALSYLPFKVSLLFRVFYHHRRDRLALLEIGGWMAATAGVILVSLAGPLLASLWIGRLGPAWWGVALGGIALGAGAVLLCANLLASDAGWGRFAGLLRASGISPLRRLADSSRFAQLHAGVLMLASPASVAQALALRGMDVGVHSARFYLAAHAVGVELTGEQAVLAGATYFFLQMLAPTGVAGVREGGTAAVLGLAQQQDLLVVVLAVSAAEATMNIVMGLAGAAWLRLDQTLTSPPPPGPGPNDTPSVAPGNTPRDPWRDSPPPAPAAPRASTLD
jgi:hypothetical protein